MRPARVFLHDEHPVCAKCHRPSRFGVRGHFIVCDAPTGEGRTRCGTFHYLAADHAGNTVLVRVTKEEVREVLDSGDMAPATLSRLGLPQMAREMLDGAQRAA